VLHVPRRAARLLSAALLCGSLGFLAGCVDEDVMPEIASELESSAKLDPAAAPSRNFDLSNWKLTLPSGHDVQADELNSGYQYAGVFFTDRATGGMVFRCPNLAGTTANSNYSRTELREMLAPGGSASADANNWTPEDGGTLIANLRVDKVSTTGDAKKMGRVVIGQIHGPTTEVVRLYYEKKPEQAKGRIYAAFETVANQTTYSSDLVSNASGGGIALGERFGYVLRLLGPQLRVTIRRQSGELAANLLRTIDLGYLGQNLYFKAGVYNQNNTGDAADYVQASFFRLTHTHP
jgi:hypothetical protein